MFVKDILQQLELGNPVAEFDQELPRYFLITDACNRLIQGKAFNGNGQNEKK